MKGEMSELSAETTADKGLELGIIMLIVSMVRHRLSTEFCASFVGSFSPTQALSKSKPSSSHD